MSNPTELPDLERAEFEAAWRAKYDMPATVQFSTFSDGRYQATAINDFYEGWCMARRAKPEGEAPQAGCTVPPEGWYCTRAPGHDGPCAARPIAQQAAASGALEKSARALAEKWHKDAVDTGFATSEAAVELLEVLDAAPSAPGTPEAPQPPFPISDDEMVALRRFWECATDGEGYDVEKAMMQRLAEMGLVQRKSGAYYMATDFGLYILGEYTIQRAAQLDGGQEGSGS